ncbi:hypothetical protein TanjilG_05128 [Lupinus angustifolius]|uniref:Uncharacterized protein n=1 Tax=Lupinus angustifolius TaxID=3871 RepID=A0A1J7H1S0_LUPAN|nr:hypothetical protein TanjilG_05128 [Lupinus angustifolius]
MEENERSAEAAEAVAQHIPSEENLENEEVGGTQAVGGAEGVRGTEEIVLEESSVQDESHEDSENLGGGTCEIVVEESIVQDQSHEDNENLDGTHGVGGSQENEGDENTVQDCENSENLDQPKALSTLSRKLICMAILLGYMILGVLDEEQNQSADMRRNLCCKCGGVI